MTDTGTWEPQTEVTFQEACELLTVAEVRGIENHYGKSLDGGKMSATEMTVGVIWAWERRRALAEDQRGKLPDWKALDDWTVKRTQNYFTSEPIEVDPSEPDTDQGKDD